MKVEKRYKNGKVKERKKDEENLKKKRKSVREKIEKENQKRPQEAK